MGMQEAKIRVGMAVVMMAIVPGARIAFGDDVPPATSSAQSKSLLDSLPDHYSLTYWGNYNGPSIGSRDPFNPLPNGSDGSPQYLDSIATASYKLNPNLLLGVAEEFYYRPVIGQDITALDPAVRLQALHVIHDDRWDLKLEAWVYAPVTAPSRAASELTGLHFVQVLNYTTGPLTIGTYSYYQQNIFDGVNEGTLYDRKLYIAPNGSYSIGKNVQATIWVDWIQSVHTRGDAGLVPVNYPWDMEPGVNFDINPQLSINPFINIFPGSPSLASTYFGFVLIGKAI